MANPRLLWVKIILWRDKIFNHFGVTNKTRCLLLYRREGQGMIPDRIWWMAVAAWPEYHFWISDRKQQERCPCCWGNEYRKYSWWVEEVSWLALVTSLPQQKWICGSWRGFSNCCHLFWKAKSILIPDIEFLTFLFTQPLHGRLRCTSFLVKFSPLRLKFQNKMKKGKLIKHKQEQKIHLFSSHDYHRKEQADPEFWSGERRSGSKNRSFIMRCQR